MWAFDELYRFGGNEEYNRGWNGACPRLVANIIKNRRIRRITRNKI